MFDAGYGELKPLPRVLVLFMPGFHPARLKMSKRVTHALAMFAGTQPVVRTPYADAAMAA